MACTGAGEAGKEVSQLSSPLRVSFEDETCVNTPRRGPHTRSTVGRHSSQTALQALVHKVQRNAMRISHLRDRDSAGPLLKGLLLNVLSVFVGILMV